MAQELLGAAAKTPGIVAELWQSMAENNNVQETRHWKALRAGDRQSRRQMITRCVVGLGSMAVNPAEGHGKEYEDRQLDSRHPVRTQNLEHHVNANERGEEDQAEEEDAPQR